MLGTLRTAVVAALAQGMLVTLLLVGLLLARGRGLTVPLAALPSIELVLAFGVALTRYRGLERTATCLLAGYARVDPRQPGRAGDALCVQLVLATLGFALLTLRLAPPQLLATTAPATPAFVLRLAASSLASVGVAAFAANAHAAVLARRHLP
jgi:hypothetical protein